MNPDDFLERLRAKYEAAASLGGLLNEAADMIEQLMLDVAAGEALYDSAYKAGLQAGWNYCITDDRDQYQRMMASTEHVAELSRIRRARKALGGSND